jgi:hypothetical protein
MKERPILFSAPMVRAILSGTKTMTRRIVKPQPRQEPITNGSADGTYTMWPNDDACLEWADVIADPIYYAQAGFCSYGAPGDRLWVRETWQESDRGVHFRADTDIMPGTWRPSIFMPRWASRITLEIADVRVERVQDISEEDAQAEGVQVTPGHLSRPIGSKEQPTPYSHRQAFAALWDTINGKRAPWDSNPWVWVVSFCRI